MTKRKDDSSERHLKDRRIMGKDSKKDQEKVGFWGGRLLGKLDQGAIVKSQANRLGPFGKRTLLYQRDLKSLENTKANNRQHSACESFRISKARIDSNFQAQEGDSSGGTNEKA